MPGTSLIAKIGGQNVAVQMDVKTKNADGSVGHAILTMKSPAIAASGTISGTLAKGGTTSTAGAIQAQDVLKGGYDLKVQVTLRNADGSTSVKTVDAAQALQQAITAGTVETWLKGSQASEFRVKANIAPNLNATFDIRRDALGKTKTDVIFSRDQAYTTNVNPLTYDVKITQGGATAFSQTGIKQHAYSTWHKQINGSGSVNPLVIYDMQYLANTGAFPGYDFASGINASVVQNDASKLTATNTAPMGSGLVQKYMPNTGGRPDIGPETAWTARYLNGQSAAAAKVMYANADASGSVPWHFMDTNGDPLRVDLHPTMWLDSRAKSTDKLPVNLGSVDKGGWTTDTAHSPALTFMPYLLSGRHYYLDELQAAAAFHIAAMDPGYSGNGQGLFTETAQIRQLAWGMRDLSNAAFVSPDGDAMKAYFAKILDNNLNRILTEYVNGAKGDAQGAVEGWLKGATGAGIDVAPWQQDFVATVLGVLAERGNTKATDILKWMDGFVSERFLSEAEGYNPLNGPAYYINVLNPTTKAPYKTWSEVYQASFSGTPTVLAGYPDWAGGYAANAKAGIASIISATQSSKAIEAYGYLQSLTTKMTPDYKNDPTWDIAPELAEGRYLNANEIKVQASTTAASMTASTREAMLIGNSGGDTLTGGSGINVLMGMAGNDTLRAGSSNSYLYGGKGDDRLDARVAGNTSSKTSLTGGTGRDVFAFLAQSHATITDFKSADDRIELSGVSSGSVKVSNNGGDTLIDLGTSGRITVAGVTLSQSALKISYA